MDSNDLSGEIDTIIRVYKFTKTSFYGEEVSSEYIPVLSIEVKEKDGSITYRHFFINKNGDIWEDNSRRLKSLSVLPPNKEWKYFLHTFPEEMDAIREITLKFIEYKNNYDDTSLTLVNTLKMKFADNVVPKRIPHLIKN